MEALRTGAAAARLGVKPRTLQAWAKAGRIGRRVGGQYVFSEAELRKFSGAHEEDGDCDVDPETLVCRVCGVDHSEQCEDCGGRGFHKATCAWAGQYCLSDGE